LEQRAFTKAPKGLIEPAVSARCNFIGGGRGSIQRISFPSYARLEEARREDGEEDRGGGRGKRRNIGDSYITDGCVIRSCRITGESRCRREEERESAARVEEGSYTSAKPISDARTRLSVRHLAVLELPGPGPLNRSRYNLPSADREIKIPQGNFRARIKSAIKHRHVPRDADQRGRLSAWESRLMPCTVTPSR